MRWRSARGTTRRRYDEERQVHLVAAGAEGRQGPSVVDHCQGGGGDWRDAAGEPGAFVRRAEQQAGAWTPDAAQAGGVLQGKLSEAVGGDFGGIGVGGKWGVDECGVRSAECGI